ncbi:hypothetical protein OH717_17730 [Streptomyces albidoflavus]|uniref:hypothetical protein n=1 Tax=Streptomyces koyangensis TaxID=188770 RepID=UPI003D07C160|nr:hypothetical protein OH717_17730 [Streptomyces albidoflavus]
MSLPDFVIEVLNGTATALVSGALTYGVVKIIAPVRSIMSRATAVEQDAVIAVLGDRTAAPEELKARVRPLLEAHLAAYPAAISEFEGLTITGPATYNQINSGNGVFLNGDNHGGLTITPTGPAA